MSNYKCGFVYACRFVISTVGALLLFTVTAAARVESRVNLPQAAAEVRLNAEAKLELDSMLEGWTGPRNCATDAERCSLISKRW